MRGKRFIDILVGTTVALLALPVIALLAVASAISLRAWPFFVQDRVGLRGREFPVLKLRTLPVTAPVDADKYEISHVETTALGRFLRRTHLDELPQLLLVPIGWMSLVGPRPDTPGQLENFPPEFVAARIQVRPGVTGLWQISTAADRLIYEAPEYDLAYVARAGNRLDAWIMVRTVWTCLTRRGAITLDDVPEWAWARPAVIDLPVLEREEAKANAQPVEDELAPAPSVAS